MFENVMDTIIKTLRIMLLPNNKQETRLFEYSNVARFAYNWTLGVESDNYKNGGKFIQDKDLRKTFTKLKKTPEYSWLNNVANDVSKQAIKDACFAYKKFFRGSNKYPRFKSKKKSCPSFYQDCGRIKFTNTHVKITGLALSKKTNKQKLNWIKLAEPCRIPVGCKYFNPRIKYDGEHWWLTIGIECSKKYSKLSNDGIGIDFGIKDTAICSDKNVYKNINKTKKVSKIKKQVRRLQRSISKKYTTNNRGGESRYCKTRNIIKSERKLLKLNHRLTNIRHNYLHQVTSEIVKRKPSFICVEDLNVKGMMKNKHLSKSIQEQCFYELRKQLQYKCDWNNIEFIVADRFFPSSKLCCCCGAIKKDLKLSDRIYKCSCGNIIDRDYQASLNLKKYGENALNL